MDPQEKIEDNPIASTIVAILKKNETCEERPQTAYAIFGYMPAWWRGGIDLLEEILTGLADAGVIGVVKGLWKDQNEPYYFYLGPLDKLARV